mmetsp:Transcript_10788/g.32445  ORF Transcript_10788/g.32445 Transcript_10788/m.32445 type:complete len:459 (-) Transcript_10788:354-1730(-)
MTITGLSVAFLQVLYLMGAKAQVPATLSFYDAANSATVVATVPLVSGASGGAVNDISIDPSILPSLSAFADFPDGNSNVVGVDFRVVSGGAISCPTDVCSGQFLYNADYCRRADVSPYSLYGDSGGVLSQPDADCALPEETDMTIRVVVEATQGSPKYAPYSVKVEFGAQTSAPVPAPAPESPGFSIQLRNMGTNTLYDDLFVAAKERWEQIVVGDVEGYPQGTVSDWFSGFFDTPNDEAIDDLLIGYEFTAIDGVAGTLGEAGTRYFRRSATGQFLSTISGVMRFDEADFAEMDDVERQIVILHEIGHVLGLGTTGWTRECAVDCPADARYACPRAQAEYNKLGFTGDLLVELDGDELAQCAHWDELAFPSSTASELMTGTFERGKAQLLTTVTIGGLDDFEGYTVDYGAADPWDSTSSSLVAGLDGLTHGGLVPQRNFTWHGRMLPLDGAVPLPSS